MLTFQEIVNHFDNLDMSINTDGISLDVTINVPEVSMDIETEVLTACTNFSEQNDYGLITENYGRTIKMWCQLTGTQTEPLVLLLTQLSELLPTDNIDVIEEDYEMDWESVINNAIDDMTDSITSFVSETVKHTVQKYDNMISVFESYMISWFDANDNITNNILNKMNHKV